MLVFLFRAHRDLYQQYLEAERRIKDLEWSERDLQVRVAAVVEDNQRLVELLRVRPDPRSTDDWIKDFAEQTLQEAPFPDGKIPDSFYLTPEIPV